MNTPSGKGARTDEGRIRATAVACGIPCLTTIQAAQAAVRAMGHWRSEESKTLLINLLNDEDMWVRAEAADVLGQSQTENENVVRALLDRFQNDTPPVRIASVKALGRCPSPRAQTAVLEAAETESGEVRLAAIEALAFLSDSRALPRLVAYLKDKNWQAASAALGAVGERSDAEKAVSEISSLLLTPSDPIVLRKAIALLSSLSARNALSNVLSLADDDALHEEIRSFVYVMGKEHPKALESALRNSSPKTRKLVEAMMSQPRADGHFSETS